MSEFNSGWMCEDLSMCSNPGFDVVEGNFGFGDVLYGDEGNEKDIIRSCVATQKKATSFRCVLCTFKSKLICVRDEPSS